MGWKVYNELAWVDEILAGPEAGEDEVVAAIQLLKNKISAPTPTMLHLGCGAGGYDFHFKQHFTVTGVDLSPGMLELARKTNPDVEYLLGDMRSLGLDRKFDAVVIPDSIAYMCTLADLRQAIGTAAAHLKAGGILLVVAHAKEEFRNNNFAYTAAKGDIHVTVFENNHIVDDSTYEAAMIYLIRRGRETEIHHEIHTLGLFTREEWRGVFKECRLNMDEVAMDHLYDTYLLEDGEYKLTVFTGTQIQDADPATMASRHT